MTSEMKPMMLRWSIVIGVCALLSGAVNGVRKRTLENAPISRATG
jgi:hypothetical protein